MDEFDLLNQPVQQGEETTNTQNDGLFGSENTDTDQQEALSWQIETNVTDTISSQSNAFSDDTLNQLTSTSQTASFNDETFTNQANTNQLDSFSNVDPSSKTYDFLSNDRTEPQSGTSSLQAQSSYSGVSFTETPSPIDEFNARRQQQLAEKDAAEKRKIDELRNQAKTDLDRWYRERQMHMEQKLQSMKDEEEAFRTKALQKSDNSSCDWAKVVRLLEFSQGAQVTKNKRDVNRMKSIILQATRHKVARESNSSA
ncbi:unnamed protein product [Adineta ricciae]|uniref:Clathrin light chain n=1 Tax=Adineta ricciae TaxID=249248 RepID=A0A815GC53_ADIRI|nr:unnamed protein product [Adineta ricciae]CAF1337477.1 unnamed protein product [Adineta ricciae]